jgi:hypothetical protein
MQVYLLWAQTLLHFNLNKEEKAQCISWHIGLTELTNTDHFIASLRLSMTIHL